MTPCLRGPGKVDASGYHRITRNGRTWWAHIWAWVQKNGPVPEGHVLHHQCERRWCWNADHLEPMTRADHRRHHGVSGQAAVNAAKVVCIRGHAFSGLQPNGRLCLECRRQTQRNWYERKRGIV